MHLPRSTDRARSLFELFIDDPRPAPGRAPRIESLHLHTCSSERWRRAPRPLYGARPSAAER